jgi:hypothetical protein
MDEWMDDLRGDMGFDSSGLVSNSSLTYLEGNANILTDYISTSIGKSSPKIAYIGDHFVGDVHYCNKREGWDGIAIIEELSKVGDEYTEIEKRTPLKPMDLKLNDYSKIWGDYFFNTK